MHFNSVGESSVNQPALNLTKWMTHACCVETVFIWVKCKFLQTRGLQEYCLKKDKAFKYRFART